jgi:hypothetical protein
MTVAEIVLITLLGIGAYAGSLYLWPFRPCVRCNGTGRNKGSTRKRYGECKRCRGSGRRRRLGARTIHRGAVSLADKARARKGRKP